jgi:hypothetical protein
MSGTVEDSHPADGMGRKTRIDHEPQPKFCPFHITNTLNQMAIFVVDLSLVFKKRKQVSQQNKKRLSDF